MNSELIAEIREQLTQREAHRHLKQINRRQSFSDGKSGASVHLLQARYQDGAQVRTELLIAKQFADDERGARDADCEQAGYELLSASWLSAHLTDPPLRLNVGGQLIIIFSFADKTSLSAHSAKSLIERDELGGALGLVIEHYHRLQPHLTEPTRLENFSAYLGYCLDEKLAQKLCSAEDAPCFLKPEEWLIVGEQILENPIYNLRTRVDRPLSHVASVISVAQHGDLNADNIIFIDRAENFIFIDLEKSRFSSPFYDLSFLLMWAIKLSLFDKPARRRMLRDRSPGALRDDVLRYLSASLFEPSSEALTQMQMHIRSQGIPTFIFDMIISGLRAQRDRLAHEVEDDRELLLRFTFSIAALVRCYYESREETRADDEAQRASFREDALFYRDLSALALSKRLRELSGRNTWPVFTVHADLNEQS